MFVADFIGAPPMSFLRFYGSLRRGDRSVKVDGVPIEMPELFEDRAEGSSRSACGPSMCRSPMPRRCAAACIGAEYLGTTQIVTRDDCATARSRRDCRPANAVRVGETVGLALRPDRLSLFDATSGHAHCARRLYAGGRHG